MQRFPRFCLLCTAVLTLTLLTVSLNQHLRRRPAAPPALEDWGFSELADYLNRMGVVVRLRSTFQDGRLGEAAYLTTTDKSWEELSRLVTDSGRIHEWSGTVLCKRVEAHYKPMLHLWGDHYLVAGPFVFYGDAELLERIRAVLTPPAPAATP